MIRDILEALREYKVTFKGLTNMYPTKEIIVKARDEKNAKKLANEKLMDMVTYSKVAEMYKIESVKEI